MRPKFLAAKYQTTLRFQLACIASLIVCLSVYFSNSSALTLAIIGLITAAGFSARWLRSGTMVFILLISGLMYIRSNSEMASIHLVRTLIKRDVVIEGVVVDEAYYGAKKQVYLRLDKAKILTDGQSVTVPSKMRVSGFGSNIRVGDLVRVNGRLNDSKGSSIVSMSFGLITPIKHHSSVLKDARSSFNRQLRRYFSPEVAGLAEGLLLGAKSGLSDENQTAFSEIGLTHVLAVSGFNLTIVSAGLAVAFKFKSRRLKLIVEITGVVIFFALVAPSSSITRALIMVIISKWAEYFGLKVNQLSLVLGAAVGMAFISPIYIWRDVGFYLSFAAYIGVAIIPGIFTRWAFATSHSMLRFAYSFLIESFSVIIMTAPIIALIFGRFSPASLLANLVVMPVLPVAMLVAFIQGVTGWLLPGIAGSLAWLTARPLQIMLDLVNWVNNIGSLKQTSLSVTAWQVTIWYGLILAGCLWATYSVNATNWQRTPGIIEGNDTNNYEADICQDTANGQRLNEPKASPTRKGALCLPESVIKLLLRRARAPTQP